jgi:hypothetical protein
VSNPDSPFVGDSILGFALNEGVYEITLQDTIRFRTTHIANNQRLTTGLPDSSAQTTHVFGCSYTYGYGVNDDETFCSVLQAKLPSRRFVNYGVIGYGTVQSYLQLIDSPLNEGDEVILCFSDAHLMRNTMSPQYRSNLKIGFENSSQLLEKQMEGAHFPYLKSCEENIRFDAWDELYHDLPGRNISATINFIQTTRDRIRENEGNQIASSICLLEKMHKFCQENGANFNVVFLDKTERTDKVSDAISEINWINVNFDFTSTRFTNLPFDHHPNKAGHQLIAETIQDILLNE